LDSFDFLAKPAPAALRSAPPVKNGPAERQFPHFCPAAGVHREMVARLGAEKRSASVKGGSAGFRAGGVGWRLDL